MNSPTVQDIMTSKVISVGPTMPLLEAHDIIAKNNLDGVPVVDEENRLVGILTEYDLLTKGSALHLPTFQKILTQLKIYQKDHGDLSDDIERLKKLTVADVMNSEPLTLSESVSFEDVVNTFRDNHRVNPIPVVNGDNKV